MPMDSGGRLFDNGGVLSDFGVLLRSASAENGDALMGADGVDDGALIDRSMLLRSAGPVSLDSDLERFSTLSLVTVATGVLALVCVMLGGADTVTALLIAGPLSLGGG